MLDASFFDTAASVFKKVLTITIQYLHHTLISLRSAFGDERDMAGLKVWRLCACEREKEQDRER